MLGFSIKNDNAAIEMLDNGRDWQLRLYDNRTQELLDVINLEYYIPIDSIHPSHFDKIIYQENEPRETFREFAIEHNNIIL